MRSATITVLLLAACGGTAWEPLSDGVVRRVVPVKVRGVDRVDVTLVTPGTGAAPDPGPRTGIVLAPGGLVPPHRYEPIAAAFARHGYAVAIPSFPGDLGFFAPDNVVAARDLLLLGDAAAGVDALSPAPAKIAVAGHSLGGVVACGEAMVRGFDALLVFASYASDADPVENLRIPVLSIGGGRDCSARLETVRARFDRFPSGSIFATVPDLTHYAWTDSLAEDLKKGCTTPLSLDDAHALLAELVDTFLDAKLAGDPDAQARLDAGLPDVTLEVKP